MPQRTCAPKIPASPEATTANPHTQGSHCHKRSLLCENAPKLELGTFFFCRVETFLNGLVFYSIGFIVNLL